MHAVSGHAHPAYYYLDQYLHATQEQHGHHRSLHQYLLHAELYKCSTCLHLHSLHVFFHHWLCPFLHHDHRHHHQHLLHSHIFPKLPGRRSYSLLLLTNRYRLSSLWFWYLSFCTNFTGIAYPGSLCSHHQSILCHIVHATSHQWKQLCHQLHACRVLRNGSVGIARTLHQHSIQRCWLLLL